MSPHDKADICRQGAFMSYQDGQLPADVGPQTLKVLVARREVIRMRRRERRLAERLAKPAYVNTDASCRNGLAGLAYQSGMLGSRTELVACADITRAEHLALLMAMEDAMQVLSGPIVFRVDCAAVASLASGKNADLEGVRRRIRILLDRHPEWRLMLVRRNCNSVALALARRAFGKPGTDHEGLCDEAAC
jgi:hypothetical protein